MKTDKPTKTVTQETDEVFGRLLLAKLKWIEKNESWDELDGALINATQRRISAAAKGETPKTEGEREMWETMKQIMPAQEDGLIPRGKLPDLTDEDAANP